MAEASDEAQEAYELAQELIAEAKRSAADGLMLSGFFHPLLSALDRLPPEIGELTWLTGLGLNETQFADLTQLTTLTALRFLYFHSTRVEDLSALTRMEQLRVLDVRGTRVRDLSPLLELPQLNDLHYRNFRPAMPNQNSRRYQKSKTARNAPGKRWPGSGESTPRRAA